MAVEMSGTEYDERPQSRVAGSTNSRCVIVNILGPKER